MIHEHGQQNPEKWLFKAFPTKGLSIGAFLARAFLVEKLLVSHFLNDLCHSSYTADSLLINESSSKMKESSLPSQLDWLSLINARIKDDNRDLKTRPTYSYGSSSSTSSKSIPIDYDRLQSQEDWEFRMQEILAEERDHSMFVRIVNGMIARQGSEHSSTKSFQRETDKIVASIMRTRYKKLDNESTTDGLGSFTYDDQSDLIDNHNRDDLLDQPPDAIFIIDM
jgi:hypothetical protein